ncbi:class I SAM-dependent methyltransferase [Streptomyces sp. NPDC087440]|uniref:class I SAM-dependent methyltransferase n=1 Tax=Streptomyces sp. NPDC087440 TaxID=3365790 RepID=UPI00382F418A
MTADSSYLAVTADAYDSVASLYAELFRDALHGSPLDRAMIAAFAELARGGVVAEVGCGPGAVTAHLRDLGLDVFGVDLSPAMIALAREAYPDLRFEVGSMGALEAGDGALSGVLAWYSLIHTPPEELPQYMEELGRVVEPGGHLLIGFFEAGGDSVTPFDHKVTTAYRWPVDGMARLAADAGFVEVARMLRDSGEGERFRQGRLLLRREG